MQIQAFYKYSANIQQPYLFIAITISYKYFITVQKIKNIT